MSARLADLVRFLDGYLQTREIADEPNALNGLQVDGPESVERFAVAVDACQFTIDATVACGAQLLLVHHGLFWSGLQPATARHGSRLRALMKANVALYSSHIPLDLHPEVGNNVVLARALGIPTDQWFGDYRGHPIGVAGSVDTDLDVLTQRLRDALGVEPTVLRCGPSRVRSVGVITGGGGSMIGDAHAAGLDTFVSGEGAHHTYFDAEEHGINVIYAGHYATETVGVGALARHIETEFGLPWRFIDHPTGL